MGEWTTLLYIVLLVYGIVGMGWVRMGREGKGRGGLLYDRVNRMLGWYLYHGWML